MTRPATRRKAVATASPRRPLYSYLTFAVLLLLTLPWATACSAGGRAPRGAGEAPPETAELHHGPLTDYVPAPGLRWLLLAHPQKIAAAVGVLEALSPLVNEQGWRRFGERNGFDLRDTPAVLAGGFELGTLYLVEPPSHRESDPGLPLDRHFRQRLLRGEVVARPHPRLTRVQGIASGTPQTLLRVEGLFVAQSDGDPALVRIVEGFLLRRFSKTPAALRGATLRAHAAFAKDAPVRSWIPGPLDALSVFPDSELFRTATAALVAAEPFEHEPCPCRGPAALATAGAALRVHLGLAGPWDPSTASAAALEATWQSVAQSATGRLLHLDAPLRAPQSRVVATEDGARLELVIELALPPLARGLHEVISGELPELFGPDLPPASAEGPADHSSPAAFRRPGEAVD